jgi:hypothetical protein
MFQQDDHLHLSNFNFLSSLYSHKRKNNNSFEGVPVGGDRHRNHFYSKILF